MGKTRKAKSKIKISFAKEFANLWAFSFTNISNQVKQLATLQNKYPGEFSAIINFGLDSSNIKPLLDKMNTSDRTLLLQVLLESGSLQSRVSVMMQSTVKEKKKLSKDLADFANRIKKLEEINR